MILRLILAALLLSLFTGCPDDLPPPQRITISEHAGQYIGSRSSYYGFQRFPSPEKITQTLVDAAAKFPGSTPSAVWIVGGIRGDARKGEGACALEFPAPDAQTYSNITFQDTDKHEPYLDAFDSAGVKVFLQVEAGMADMPTLIKLVLERYGHHPSVIGFGIDVEWYPSPKDKQGNWVCDSATQIDVWSENSATATNFDVAMENSEAAQLDSLVKTYNSEYRLFLKHWVSSMCGGSPVSDIIYINDAQGYPSLTELTQTFKYWSNTFYPNDVGFQIGYGNDQPWWENMLDPFRDIGVELTNEMPNQKVHLYWVDFTLHDLDIW